MLKNLPRIVWLALLLAVAARSAGAQQSSSETWHFVASGDSRNCGDVVMPGVAETAKKVHAVFYWHLGDLRATSNIDEDIRHQPEHLNRPMTMEEYWSISWPDFIENQIKPFGSIPYYVGIGNHELIPPAKTREGFLLQFADWLDSPVLHDQRLKDSPEDHMLRTYYHWIDRGVGFFFLDSASGEQFDGAQIAWFENVLEKDMANPAIKTIVAGCTRRFQKAFPLATA